jgi:hypothetical protein
LVDRGHTFYQLHLLLDKHAAEQLELIDMIAERVQTLGGVAVGDPRHVAEITTVPRPPNGADPGPRRGAGGRPGDALLGEGRDDDAIALARSTIAMLQDVTPRAVELDPTLSWLDELLEQLRREIEDAHGPG